MAIAATTAAESATAGGALAAPAASSADSEQRFLKLLVTQLNNQDPLNPLDNAQLTSQLAQMSTVSGIEKLNNAFQSLLAQSGSSQVLQSASLIGRTVLVPGRDLVLENGTDMPFAVELPAAADSVKVTITNAAGDAVRSYDLGALAPGVKTVSWDGLSDNGSQLAGGVYTLKVEATSSGAAAAAGTLTYSKVSSIAQGLSGVTLDLESGARSDLAEIRLIL
jgi:flagellar basal-body rod modification protein FlgD